MDDITLARTADQKGSASRVQINQLVFPIISSKTACFCKKYCQGNQFKHICTLPEHNYAAPSATNGEASLCEWGNASYAWMLDDLTNKMRLDNFRGDNGASLKTYLQSISHSVAFRERWKDWRFKNRAHVPSCIKEIHQIASAVFLGLYNQKSPVDIAQQLKLNIKFIADLADKITIVLTKNRKLHLLLPKTEVSLTGYGLNNNDPSESNEHQGHIPTYDSDLENEEQKILLKTAWNKLNCVEQFVLDEMLIQEEDALDVLESLQAMNISIKKDVAPEDTNRQQLFYFKRKAIKKLATLAGL